MGRYSAVTLDFYDDNGATLREKFPSVGDLPDTIKTANVKPKGQLADEDFALVAIDGGHVMRKLACNDAGTTAMSVIYFMEHGDKLPEEAVKTAATKLTERCLAFGLLPPAALTKEAGAIGLYKFANGDEPEDKGAPPTQEQREKIRNFIRANPKLSDDEFHAFVERMGLNPHFAEAVVYDMAHELSKKAADIVAGGRADKIPPSKFPPKQMAMGRKVEEEHTSNPDLAEEIASDHLEEFPDYYTRLKKMEEEAKKAKEKKAQAGGRGLGPGRGMGLREGCPIAKAKEKAIVDITGQIPRERIKTARPVPNEDYCVVTSEGKRLYPIDTYDRIKMAEEYYLDNRRQMEPSMRRQYAVKLAAKAEKVGYPLDGHIKEAGATTKAPPGYIKAAFEIRKIVCADEERMAELESILEKNAEAEVLARALYRFDHSTGLSSLWDTGIPDPWASTYCMHKVADEVIWEDAADRVTRGQLENLRHNRLYLVEKQFSDPIAAAFFKDPVGVFNSLPLPQQRIFARLADDVSSDGGSGSMYTPDK